MPTKQRAKTDEIIMKMEGHGQVTDLPTRRSDDFVAVHANGTRVSENFYDAIIVFNQVVPPDPSQGDKVPYVLECASVSMSWEHLQALADLLNKRLKLYEERHGQKIRRLPSDES